MAARPICRAETGRIASFGNPPSERSIMKFPAIAVLLVLATPAFAQQQPPPQPQTTDTWRMPYERGFWGHAGVSFGNSKLDVDCPSGAACDDKDQFFKAYAGGRFS